MKKMLISILAVFVAWLVLDYLIHGVFLMGTYEETAQLWRPVEEMKTVVMILVTLITAASFCYIYLKFVSKKSMKNGLLYGFIFGIGFGTSLAYGSYAVMPIPYSFAFVWFIGTLIEAIAAGAIVGGLIKE